MTPAEENIITMAVNWYLYAQPFDTEQLLLSLKDYVPELERAAYAFHPEKYSA